MKNKFKLGDILEFQGFNEDPNHDFTNGGICTDGLKPGDMVRVKTLFPYDNPTHAWFEFFGGAWWHIEDNFKRVSEGTPSKVVIILRRAADDRSVRKALEDMGVNWGNGSAPTTKSFFKAHGCRALIIYTKSKSLYWSSSYGLYTGAKEIRERETSDGVVIINTKPSVKLAISNLSTILT